MNETVFDDVQTFHSAAGAAVAVRPSYPTRECATLRLALIDEEHHEATQALATLTNPQTRTPEALAELAKELCDLIYVAAGTGIALYGANFMNAAWAEVHRSNMSKIGPDGLRVRADGKILKPDTYSPADIHTLIKHAGTAR